MSSADSEGLEKIKARLCALEELVGAYALDQTAKEFLASRTRSIDRQAKEAKPWGGPSRLDRIRLKVFKRVLAHKSRVVRTR